MNIPDNLVVSCITSLDWMIETLDWQNSQTGMNAQESQAMAEAKAILKELKSQQSIALGN